jgi:hypothetical protein
MNPTHDSRVCCAEHARAGAGLPAIERGMPAPAGTGLSRRSFLLRSAGLALSVYGAGRLTGLPAFEEGIARAQAGGAGTVLVSVFLDGGADSLSILAPVGDPDYRRLRPGLALPEGGTAFSEDPRMSWHPAAAPLAALHAEGKVSVMPAVGYDHPDQSHFVSRHFWEVGATDAQLRSGWLGRVIDRIGTADNPLQGVSLGGSLGPSLAAARMPVAAVDAPEDFGFWAPGAWGPPGELAIPACADARASRRCSAPACRSAARRCRRRVRGTRTPTRPARCRTTSRSRPTACTRSSATSRRAGSPTACSRSCGRSSAAAPRRTAPAPITAPPASGS